MQRLEAADDLCIFDDGLDLVQSLLKHVKRGMRLLPPVTRELLEKCLFMLKLKTTTMARKLCVTLFFFERLLNAGTEISERMSVKVVYSVCTLLLQGLLTYSQ